MDRWCFLKMGRTRNQGNLHGKNRLFFLFKACMIHAGFLLFLQLPVAAQESFLDQPVSIPRQKTTLYEALNLIAQKTGCFFIYDSETVSNARKVKVQADGQPLRVVLDNLLDDPSLDYRELGKHVLIYKRKAGSAHATGEAAAPQTADTSTLIVLRGHVYDRSSGAAIPYATVGIPEGNTGTVTNLEGFFVLKIPRNLGGLSLVVSHLGYLNRQVPIPLLEAQQADLYLERRVISIQEVIIRYIDPVAIIAKAMDRRKVNNATEPVYLTSFYREGVEKNDQVISYSEAVFRIYKLPYDHGEYGDQVKLLKSRKVQNTAITDTVFLKLKAGVQSALELDIVKSVPGFLDLSPPVEYVYRYAGLVSYNEKDAYAISFVQRPLLSKALYTGTLYVEKEGFAILGAEFGINPEYLDLAAENLVLRKSLKLKVKLEKISYRVSYLNAGGRYYLNHVRCDIDLKTRLRHRIGYDRFSTFLELTTCAIDTLHVTKFPRQETLKPQVIFADQPYTRDDAFWEGFNVIAPEASLSEALSKIIGRIEEIR